MYCIPFCDALALRYGWQPVRLPLKCVCGADFVVEHAMNCPHGAFQHFATTSYVISLLI